MTIQCQQAGSGNATLGIYSVTGTLLAKTDPFATNATGLYSKAITTNGSGGAISSYALVGGTTYYFCLHSTQANNGAGFRGTGGYANNGVAPYTAIYNTISAIPNSITIGSAGWTSQTFYIAASTAQIT